MFIFQTSRVAYILFIKTGICIHQQLHILYIININKQDITYLKDDLTCAKVIILSVMTLQIYLRVLLSHSILVFTMFALLSFLVQNQNVLFCVKYDVHFHSALLYVHVTYIHLTSLYFIYKEFFTIDYSLPLF